MDIVVTLPKSRGGLFHLQEKVDAPSYWAMKRKPKNFDEDVDVVFICCEGVVHGFFSIFNYYKEEDPMEDDFGSWIIEFEQESFAEIIPIPMKGFQGFRYRKFEYEVVR